MRFQHRPWVGCGFLAIPFVLIGVGAGIALMRDEEGVMALVGVAIALASLLLLWPWLYTREVVIDDDDVHVRTGLSSLGGLGGRSERHPRAALLHVRYSEKSSKPSTTGGSQAKTIRMHLVAPEVEIEVPLERMDLDEARSLGAALELPVERVVDGEVAERWDASGRPLL